MIDQINNFYYGIEKSVDLEVALRHIERTAIERALEISGGNKSKAAMVLGLKRTTLIEKIKRLPKEQESEEETRFNMATTGANSSALLRMPQG
jgi:DNA-binding NtrC family response regulator